MPQNQRFQVLITHDTEAMHNEATWTWVLLGFEFIGITGMWLVGARKWWGWGMVLTGSTPWLAYAIVFNKPGFIVMSLIWITTHSRNMFVWRKHALVSTITERAPELIAA